MATIDARDLDITIRQIKPKQGFVTVVVSPRDSVRFIPDKAVQEILDGSAKGVRRAVKVNLKQDGKADVIGWVNRKWLDWNEVRDIIKEEV